MLKLVWILVWFCVSSRAKIFDIKLITAVRNAIERNLNYIDDNYDKVNVDCLFGVVLTTAIIKDGYQNGTHVMDDSSQGIIGKSADILKRSIPLIKHDKLWIAQYILDYRIWQKDIKYKNNQLYLFAKIPDHKVLENVFKYQNVNTRSPNTDTCLQDIGNWTVALKPQKCLVSEYCWKQYYGFDKFATGYELTHRLLLFQLAKARKCEINLYEYDKKTRQLCSLIFAEVFNGDYFNKLDDIFDLFLEQIVLCGYEGYIEFLKNKWLYYILKSQRPSGCYPGILKDDLKSRIKRSTNVFEDGCADHTTGLGAAVLALHYNYIIKEDMNILK